MPFKRTVEIGRIAMINYGADYGKLVVISDVVDHNRALIDRPDEIRRTINFKRLAITDYKVDIPRLAKKSVLKKALEDADVFGKFAASNWGEKIAKREAKASLNDFERHVAAVKKMKRSAKVRSAFNKLKKSA
eukprot:jgi/Picsp_1/6044/NSC_03398-R1_ribosomal protein l14 component of cytosolic 80s ribosome and 60s large subunit